MPDFAGNTLALARNISLGSSTSTFSDAVGPTDLYDFYRFSVSQSGSLNVSLNDLQRDADLYLIQDRNGNGLFESSEAIASSTLGGTGIDTILQNLTAGTYYLGVEEYGGDTPYNLRASFTTDGAGDSLSSARSVLVGATPTVITDAIGNGDPNDYYRFNVTSAGQFSLSLSGLSADAEVDLLNANGTVIKSSTNGSSDSESIVQALTAGTYYVRVYPYNSAATAYSLSLALATPTDLAGNSLDTARQIAIGSSPQVFRDGIGNGDSNDYYRFSLDGPSDFSLRLSELSADADVQLLNASGLTIASSTAGSSTAETIAQQLTAGTYYVRVYPYSGSTNYALSLAASPTDLAGNTLATARAVTIGATPQVFTDAVGSSDPNDYYRFTLSDSRTLQLGLTGLSSDADVQLLNSAGALITTSALGGAASETITQALTAGTYYVRVFPDGGSTTYNLSLAAIVPDLAGNSLDTARSVTLGPVAQTFNDAIGDGDPNDYYRFSLGATSNFSLGLAGLSADADVELLSATGSYINGSFRGGSTGETIAQQLNAGTYYIRVYPYSGSTSYSLNLAATVVDLAGDTLATARSVNLSPVAQTFTDGIGNGDLDYYRFSLSNNSSFQLNLSGLSIDADVQLLNSSGTVIGGSSNSGTANETIAQPLAAGTYYVRVSPYGSGSSTYNLTLSASPIASGIADDTLATARLITLGTTPQIFNDSIGNGDLNDYYRFTLTESRSFQLGLSGLSSDADVQLLNSSGVSIGSSSNSGTSSEAIDQQLTAGTYYIRVYPYSGATNYSLSLSTSISSINPNFNSTYGYGLVNAAAAVAQAAGQPTFAPVSNSGYSWENNLINAPEAWARGYTGQGIVVAVVDSGVDTNHVDLRNNIWVNSREVAGNGIDDDSNGYIDDINGWDFVDRDSRPLDGNGHGTHVAGTIAATNNNIGVTGVAYGARIMAVRVLNSSGSGSSSNVAAGIRYAANNGARVINLSLGSSSYNAETSNAVQYAYSRGAIVVMAAGNEGARQPGHPAQEATRWGLSVGAVDRNSTIGYFSNRAGTNSQMRHIMAPGVDIYSTSPDNNYVSLNGTSMAAPQVSGLVALMLSANNSLTPDQVFQTVTGTATRLTA
jgi:trimeric autotransporter adhesin